MVYIGAVNCSLTCWECKGDCPIKMAMQNLPEAEFYRQTIENLKANAGRFILLNGWSYEQSQRFIQTNAVALKIARTKYLETLQ